LIHDTPEAVLTDYESLLAARGPAERLRMALDMFDSTRALVRAGLRRVHPEASEGEIEKLVFLRYYEHDLPRPLIERVLERIDERYSETAAG
jgi:hypothetical protein